MSANPTQDQLRQASAEHVRSARAVLSLNESKQNVKGGVGIAPKSAAYLAHVAVECALKLRMLKYHSKIRTEEMRTPLGESLFKTLFRSKDGHDLRLLSRHASLSRQLSADGIGELLSGRAWARMTSSERPFDLRYGTSTTTRQEALEEVEVAQVIIGFILLA